MQPQQQPLIINRLHAMLHWIHILDNNLYLTPKTSKSIFSMDKCS